MVEIADPLGHAGSSDKKDYVDTKWLYYCPN